MYTLEISKIAMNSLERYIESYEKYMCEFFSDTWLGEHIEEVIIANYVSKSNQLFLDIYMHIQKRIWNDEVYGKRPDRDDDTHFTLITPIADRTIIIDYIENIHTQTRRISDIRILRD